MVRSQTRHTNRKHNHPYRPSTAISGEVAVEQDIPTESTIILTVHPPPSVVRSQTRHTNRKHNHPYRPSTAISGEVAVEQDIPTENIIILTVHPPPSVVRSQLNKTYQQKTLSSLPSIHRHQWWGRSRTRHTNRKHNHPYRPSTAISGEVAVEQDIPTENTIILTVHPPPSVMRSVVCRVAWPPTFRSYLTLCQKMSEIQLTTCYKRYSCNSGR